MSNCKVSLAQCKCAEPEGHVDNGQPIHKCEDTEACKGEWTGETEATAEPVVYPGGYATYEEAATAALLDMFGE